MPGPVYLEHRKFSSLYYSHGFTCVFGSYKHPETRLRASGLFEIRLDNRTIYSASISPSGSAVVIDRPDFIFQAQVARILVHPHEGDPKLFYGCFVGSFPHRIGKKISPFDPYPETLDFPKK